MIVTSTNLTDCVRLIVAFITVNNRVCFFLSFFLFCCFLSFYSMNCFHPLSLSSSVITKVQSDDSCECHSFMIFENVRSVAKLHWKKKFFQHIEINWLPWNEICGQAIYATTPFISFTLWFCFIFTFFCSCKIYYQVSLLPVPFVCCFFCCSFFWLMR